MVPTELFGQEGGAGVPELVVCHIEMLHQSMNLVKEMMHWVGFLVEECI